MFEQNVFTFIGFKYTQTLELKKLDDGKEVEMQSNGLHSNNHYGSGSQNGQKQMCLEDGYYCFIFCFFNSIFVYQCTTYRYYLVCLSVCCLFYYPTISLQTKKKIYLIDLNSCVSIYMMQ